MSPLTWRLDDEPVCRAGQASVRCGAWRVAMSSYSFSSVVHVWLHRLQEKLTTDVLAVMTYSRRTKPVIPQKAQGDGTATEAELYGI